MTSNHSQTNVRFYRAMFCILLCGALLLPAYSRAKAVTPSLTDETLKTIIIDNYAPYTYVNEQGQPDGFSVDLMKAVAQVMGFNLDIKVDTWAHAVSVLENGDIDFLPMMAYSAERDKTFDFSPPHTIAYDAFFTRQDASAINSMDDLAGKTIIVMENDQAHQYLKSVPSIKAEQLILVDSLPEALQLLASGKGDTALMPKLVGLLLIRDLNLTNLEESPVVVEAYNRPFSFAVKNGNQVMLERLNQGMNIIKATGQYDEIYKKWFGALEPAGAYNELLIKYIGEIMLAVALIGAILLLWTFLLRRQVAAHTQSLKLEMQEHKRAEEALRESEDKFKYVFEYSVVGKSITQFNGGMHVNKALCDMLGYSPQEMQDKKWQEITHPDDIELTQNHINTLLSGGKESTRFVKRFIHKNGSIVWVDLSSTIRRDGQNKPLYLMSALMDITERKQAQAEMENLARFPAENPNPVLRVDQGGNLLYANEAGIALLPDWDLVIGEPVPQTLHQAVIETMSGQSKEWVDTVQGGRIISFSITPFVEAGYVNIYGRDVTRSRQAEAERERLLVELERKNKELESIIYMASHDLRSPLVNIQGFGKHLQKYFEQVLGLLKNAQSLDELRSAAEPILTERIPKALHFVEAGSAKMDILINGLLRLSRIGRARFQMKTVDMNSLVQNVLDAMAFQIKKSGAHIRLESPLVECYGDENQLSQVFSNLLDNAVKYRAPDRPLTITISSEIKEHKAAYSIADTGLGIAPEHQDKIWEVFHRFEEDTAISGEGLGLTIARRIIEYHNGRIWVESKPGEGSCFHIELPLEESRLKL